MGAEGSATVSGASALAEAVTVPVRAFQNQGVVREETPCTVTPIWGACTMTGVRRISLAAGAFRWANTPAVENYQQTRRGSSCPPAHLIARRTVLVRNVAPMAAWACVEHARRATGATMGSAAYQIAPARSAATTAAEEAVAHVKGDALEESATLHAPALRRKGAVTETFWCFAVKQQASCCLCLVFLMSIAGGRRCMDFTIVSRTCPKTPPAPTLESVTLIAP